MWVLSRSTLQEFWEKHRGAEIPLRAWLGMTAGARWANPSDIKRVFSTASFVGNDRIVFNIGGNNYRLVVAVDYAKGRMFVRFVGTHAEYDKINAAEV